MLTKLIPLLCMALFAVPAFPQTSSNTIDDIISGAHAGDFKARVLTYVEAHPGTPEALFLRGLAAEDAQRSVRLYNQLVVDYPSTPLAGRALYRIAQYYFSRGLYVAARREFLKIIEKYPESKYDGEAMYFAAACLCAAGQTTTCRSELQNFLDRNPKSVLVNLAKDDLKELKSSGAGDSHKSRPRKKKGTYSLQLGAFSIAENAENMRSYFDRLGFIVEVVQKQDKDKTMFLVWLGKYDLREAAESAGDSLRRDYNKPYRIVERDAVLGEKRK